MLRKLAITAATMSLLAGFVLADDDKGPLEKLMEKIQTKTNGVRNVTRNAANYAKGSGSIAKDCEEVIKLGKESRDMKEPAEAAKKPLAEWQKLTDDMIRTAEELAKVSGNPKSTQAQAKEAFTAFNKTCAACHNVFKKDE